MNNNEIYYKIYRLDFGKLIPIESVKFNNGDAFEFKDIYNTKEEAEKDLLIALPDMCLHNIYPIIPVTFNKQVIEKYFIFYIDNSYALMRGLAETFICVKSNEVNRSDVISFVTTYEDKVKIKTVEAVKKPSDAEIFDLLYDDNEKTTIYIDMDNTIFDYDSAYAKRKQEEPSLEYPQSEKGFFENLEPLEHAIRVVKALIDSPKYRVFFASAPSYYNPHSYTDKRLSIEKYFGFEHVDKLILICQKDELKDKKRILIDDIDYGYGQENFTNHMHFGSPSCPDWLYVEKVLL